MSAREARAALERSGWGLIGEGDWSWVLVAPRGETVARVTPWDPAYRLHAEQCRAHPNRYLQCVERIDDLMDGGHVVFMQRLWPPDPERAEAFCAAIGLGAQTGYEPKASPEDIAVFAGDADLDALRRVVQAARDFGAANIPFWGGSDIRPGNVMADRAGQLKLIDPLFVAGKTIIAAIQSGERELLAAIPKGSLEAFLSIPAVRGAAEPLRQSLRDLDLID